MRPQQLRSKLRKMAAAGALATCIALTPLLAHAEGSWTGSMSAVNTGFTSRSWTDKNADANGTIIWHKYCTGVYSSISTVHYRLEKTGLLVENRGEASFGCFSGNTYREYNYGRQPAGNYRFKVTKFNGSTRSNGNRLTVTEVGVKY